MATNLPVDSHSSLQTLQLRKNADTESIEVNLREKTGKQVLWRILEVKGANVSYMGYVWWRDIILKVF